MAPDLADRLRTAIGDHPAVGEIRMFGGLCFTLNGNMLCGTMKDGEILFRVGETQEAAALKKPGARVMNFTGREMHGFIMVEPSKLSDWELKNWVSMATAYVGPMPPKKKKK